MACLFHRTAIIRVDDPDDLYNRVPGALLQLNVISLSLHHYI